MLLQKCANFSDCGPINACVTDTHIQPEYYPVLLLSMLSGEFCLRLKPYLVVKISSDVVTEHCCQVCFLAMMFCHSNCRLCAGMCGKWLRNQETPCTTWFGLLTLRQANMGYEKYSLHLIFKFYLNRDTSVLELFPAVVFQLKKFSVSTHLPDNRSRL